MAEKRRRLEPPRLQGSPRKLAGVIPLGEKPTLEATLDLPDLALDPAAVAVQEKEAPDGRRAAHVRVAVPPSTSPGSYRTSIPLSAGTVQVQVDVEPRRRLRIAPRRLILSARAGETVTASVTATNVGNVPIDIRDELRFGMFDASGVNRAIGAAFATSLPSPEARINVFVDEVARSHLGLVGMRVDGAGALPPGAARDLKLELTVPNEASPGRQYYGVLRLPGARFKVRIEVPRESTPTRRRSKEVTT